MGERGHRVLLVDRDRFPSDTLSTHFLSPFAVEPLRRLGVLESVEAAGFRRISRARTWIEDCLFEGPVGPPGTYALAHRRSSLDALLILHAQNRGGVEFWEHTAAERLLTAEDGAVRGAVVLPLYQETIAATQLCDAPPESLIWLRSAFVSPHFARALMYWLPTVLAGGLPPELTMTMQRLAGLMGASPAQVR